MEVFDSILVKFGATIVGTIALAIPVFIDPRFKNDKSGKFVADITKDYMKNSSLLISLAKSIGKIIISYKDLQNLAGYSCSVNELAQVIKEVTEGKYVRQQVNEEIVAKYTGGSIEEADFIEFSDVPIITPNGELLMENINFKILPGQHTFIAGSNGCGKSSLFRILGELWPLKGGKISKPNFKHIFYIPQKPYFSKGNLRDQIIYPMTFTEFKKNGGTDEELEKLLEYVEATHVLQREKARWESIKEWKDILSGGEKQRVSMARLYFHKPTFAILDECTSAVSVDVEDKMYTQAKNLGITLITVSHRKSLHKFHDYMVKFKENSIIFDKMNEDVINEVDKRKQSSFVGNNPLMNEEN